MPRTIPIKTEDAAAARAAGQAINVAHVEHSQARVAVAAAEAYAAAMLTKLVGAQKAARDLSERLHVRYDVPAIAAYDAEAGAFVVPDPPSSNIVELRSTPSTEAADSPQA